MLKLYTTVYFARESKVKATLTVRTNYQTADCRKQRVCLAPVHAHSLHRCVMAAELCIFGTGKGRVTRETK